MSEKFNIFSQLQKELAEFKKPIRIATTSKSKKGYLFSQEDTLGLIDFYTNSKFESGDTDSEGQQKIFLNGCTFRAEVASKQVDIDLANYNFIPETYDSVYSTILMRRRFRDWAKDNFYGEQINEMVERYPKYGTVVTKTVGKEAQVVPLKTLFNQPDAKSLKTGRFCGEIHENMTLSDMQEFPDWDLSGVNLGFDETETVHERYGRVPLDWYNKKKGLPVQAGYEKRTVYVMAIIVLESKSKSQKGEDDGKLLFLEEAECPYEEVHWRRQDGRWLGIGVVEENFENQKARNMVENFRKKNLQWSGKKIFVNTGEEVSQNLVSEVKDGQVLNLGMNGQLTVLNTASVGSAEYENALTAYERNSDQKAFTYEVATGEGMNSGTPFRLGVILSDAVNSYFGFKREKLGLFLKRVYIVQILPIFKKENRKEQTMMLSRTAEEYKDLQQAIKNYLTNRAIVEAILAGKEVDQNILAVGDQIDSLPSIQIDIPKGFWDEVQYTTTLEITGEEVDVQKKMETMTNLYQTMVQQGNPEAKDVLNVIMALAGEKLRPSSPQIQNTPAPMGGGKMPMDKMPSMDMCKKTQTV